MGTKELKACLKKLFFDGSYSDLTISCGERQFRVYKALVCLRSAYFAAACRDLAEECDVFDEDPNPATIFPEHSTDQALRDLTPEMALYGAVYVLAEKYSIGWLKGIAFRRF
ncbi:hypothetical protein F5Y16DRAFT_386520 [Xylariaceae sp. FL0255]|nr:hypothetical protein F5Y16DRAFT_386520 [Xylariaceae sp. FL0255]